MKEEKWPETVDGQLIFRLRDISHVMRALYEGKGQPETGADCAGAKWAATITQRESDRPARHPAGLGQRGDCQAWKPPAAVRRTRQARPTGGRWTLTLTEKRARPLARPRPGRSGSRRHEEMFACASAAGGEGAVCWRCSESSAADWADRYPAASAAGSTIGAPATGAMAVTAGKTGAVEPCGSTFGPTCSYALLAGACSWSARSPWIWCSRGS